MRHPRRLSSLYSYTLGRGVGHGSDSYLVFTTSTISYFTQDIGGKLTWGRDFEFSLTALAIYNSTIQGNSVVH
jgi:hypothetical protein